MLISIQPSFSPPEKSGQWYDLWVQATGAGAAAAHLELRRALEAMRDAITTAITVLDCEPPQ